MDRIDFEASSFRDPSGFLFRHEGTLLRHVNISYADHYRHFMTSGLYDELIGRKLIVPHKEEDGLDEITSADTYCILKPEIIPFIIYPYEWCHGQYKDAALATLEIAEISFRFGMTLKDASAYNIQFYKGRPVFIDTLSFERYEEGQLWKAYKQFCQHFLAPIALMSYVDGQLAQLMHLFIDGIPLDLAVSMLPLRSFTNLPLLTHLHMHAIAQQRWSSDRTAHILKNRKIGTQSYLGLLDSLKSNIQNLPVRQKKSLWDNYYASTNYSNEDLAKKREIIEQIASALKPKMVWDLGANSGLFSRIVAPHTGCVLSIDSDCGVVENNYQICKRERITNVIPMIADLNNPPAGRGWENKERQALLERGPADMAIAVALIHHLVLGNNVPMDKLAYFFKKLCRTLVIEFIPKSDSQIQKLLCGRQDIYSDYTRSNFEAAFSKYFHLCNIFPIGDSKREIYLMERTD